MARLYKSGALLFGLGTSAFASYKIFETEFQEKTVVERSESKTIRQIWDEEEERVKPDTCAEKIFQKGLGVCLFYPVNKLTSNETSCAVLDSSLRYVLPGLMGCSIGFMTGLTWPLSVPLVSLHYMETQYGYKLC